MVDTDTIRKKAREILESGEVRRLIGWKRGTYGYESAPAVLKDSGGVDELIFDPTCVQNLASFITLEEKPPLPRGVDPDLRKIAVMVKGCDSRAIVQQLVEKAYPRDKVIVLGIPCRGVVDKKKCEKLFGESVAPVAAEESGDKIVFEINGEKKEADRKDVVMDKCLRCRYPNPLVSDKMMGEEVEVFASDDYSDVAEFEKLSQEDKWKYFDGQFSKCIRCYSCRNACPMCYCVECIVQIQKPQWTRRSTDISENTAYHLQRAWHLAGRCTECNECQRVCPVDIPLMTLNRKMTREVNEMFDYEPGVDPEAAPLLASYNPQDPEDDIM